MSYNATAFDTAGAGITVESTEQGCIKQVRRLAMSLNAWRKLIIKGTVCKMMHK
jgi:hypothetical protein